MNKLKVKTKVLYGLGGVGDASSYNFIENYALFFLTTIAGVEPVVAGAVIAVGSVWETVFGAVIGYASDQLECRLGKRKPFLLFSALPLGICLSLMFTAVDASPAVKAAYYIAVMVVYTSAFSSFYVPYLTWGSEITRDYDERSQIRGYVQAFCSVGMVIGQALPIIAVDLLMQIGLDAAKSWQTMAVFCAACAAGCILMTGVFTKDKYAGQQKTARRQKQEPRGDKVKMIRAYIRAFQFKPVKCVLWASVFYLIGYAVFCADRVYYFSYNMGLSAGAISLIMLYMAVTSVAFIPLIVFGVRWTDKRMAYIIGMAISVFSMGVYGVTGIHNWLDIFLFVTGYSFGSVVYWQLMPALIYDVCEADQLVNRENRAGLLISLQSLAESIANAAGLQLLGVILSLAGFQGEAEAQSHAALQWTGLSMTFIPALFMAASLYMIIRYPITKDLYEKTITALRQREEGEEPDIKEFEVAYCGRRRRKKPQGSSNNTMQ